MLKIFMSGEFSDLAFIFFVLTLAILILPNFSLFIVPGYEKKFFTMILLLKRFYILLFC